MLFFLCTHHRRKKHENQARNAGGKMAIALLDSKELSRLEKNSCPVASYVEWVVLLGYERKIEDIIFVYGKLVPKPDGTRLGQAFEGRLHPGVFSRA
jgi:hypothetical protein